MGTPYDLDLDWWPTRTPGRKKARAPRQTGWFVHGPIPWKWISRASTLPGRVLQVAMLLWLGTGMKHGGPVTLSAKGLASLGVSKQAARRALAQLESAQLVTVERHSGRLPRVTLLDAPDVAASSPE